MKSIGAHRRVSVVLAGRDLGVFDEKSGGDTSAETSKHRPGGRIHNEVVGGLPDTEDVTVSRAFDRDRDIDVVRFCRQWVGRGEATITEQWLTGDYAPVGPPTVYNGLLSSVAPSDYDSDDSDPAELELTFAVSSQVG